jgi:hypothetical protein
MSRGKRSIEEEEEYDYGKEEEDFIVDDEEEINEEDDYVEEDEEEQDDEDEEDEDEKPKRPAKKSKSSRSFSREEWTAWIYHRPSLAEIDKMVNELASTTKGNEKKEILAKHNKCILALLYTSHPYWKYNIKSDSLKKSRNSVKALEGGKTAKDVFHLLDMLKGGLRGNVAKATCLSFIAKNKKFEQLIYDMIDKKLRTRCKAAGINKVYEGLIPKFSVSLAYDFEKYPNTSFTDGTW